LKGAAPIPLCGELALEEPMDLSQDVMNELMTEFGYTLILYSNGQINCWLLAEPPTLGIFKGQEDLESLIWDRYVVPKRRQGITTIFALEEGTDRFSRNVGKELPLYAA
jgi:hypothetical protein